MKDQALRWARKVWGDFKSFTPGQKTVTIAAVVALIVGGVLFINWKTTPKYAPLFSNLSTTDAAAVVDKLSENGTPYQISSGGSQILVPQDKVYETRLALSSDGLPGSSSAGYSLLDDEGITTSEFKQQVDFQRAIEGELAKTIESIQGVQVASVHLAIPKQDVFNDGNKKPTAAVMITMEPGASVTNAQVQSVVYLVSSSVPELSADDVTVADSSGQVLAAPGDNLGGIGGSDTRSQMTLEYNQRLSTALQTMLNKAVGPGNSVVTVNADLDFDTTSTTTQNYTHEDDMPPLWTEETTESYTGSAAEGGVFGTGEPDEEALTGGGEPGSYEKSHRTVTNALGTVTQTVQNTPGSVKKLSVAVLLDDAAPDLNIPAIESLVSSAVGLDPDRGDSLAIQAMAFDTSAQDAATDAEAAAAEAAAAKAAKERMDNWIRQGVIVGLIVIVLIITWLASRRRKRAAAQPAPVDDYDMPLTEIPQDALLPREMPEPAPSETGAGRRALVALADEQPDDVARVLSGWLGSTDSPREGASR